MKEMLFSLFILGWLVFSVGIYMYFVGPKGERGYPWYYLLMTAFFSVAIGFFWLLLAGAMLSPKFEQVFSDEED